MTITPRRLRQIIKEEILAEIELQQGQEPVDPLGDTQELDQIRLGTPIEQQQQQATLQQYEELAEQIIVFTVKSSSPAQIVPAIKRYMQEKNLGMVESGALSSMVKGKLASTTTAVHNVLDTMVHGNIIKGN